jgi:hypothetical protein
MRYFCINIQCYRTCARYLLYKCPVISDIRKAPTVYISSDIRHSEGTYIIVLLLLLLPKRVYETDAIQKRPWQGRGVSCERESVAATEAFNRKRTSGGNGQETFCNFTLISYLLFHSELSALFDCKTYETSEYGYDVKRLWINYYLQSSTWAIQREWL